MGEVFCRHPACVSALAARLAIDGYTAEATEVHKTALQVPCLEGPAAPPRSSSVEVDPRLRAVKVLPGPPVRDAVLRETMTAVMWLRYAVQSMLDGRPQLARHLAELAGEAVLNTLVIAENPGPPVDSPPDPAEKV